MDKLVEEAEQIGIHASEFDWSKHTFSKAYNYAKCYEKKTSPLKSPIVKYFWDMFPLNVCFPIEALVLDILLCPCCFCCYPFIQIGIVFPWNLISLILEFIFLLLFSFFVVAPLTAVTGVTLFSIWIQVLLLQWFINTFGIF